MSLVACCVFIVTVCALCVVRYVLRIDCRALFVVCCVLGVGRSGAVVVVRWSLFAVCWCLVFVVQCSLFVVGRLSFVVCSLRLDVCCSLLRVVCRVCCV